MLNLGKPQNWLLGKFKAGWQKRLENAHIGGHNNYNLSHEQNHLAEL